MMQWFCNFVARRSHRPRLSVCMCLAGTHVGLGVSSRDTRGWAEMYDYPNNYGRQLRSLTRVIDEADPVAKRRLQSPALADPIGD